MENWMSFVNSMKKEAGREIEATEPIELDLFDEDCRILS